MKQTLKLTLYYFLYQLGTLSFFTFIYTAIQLCSTYFETQNLVYPENGYTPPFLLTLIALVLSNLIMGWHLVHFKYIDLKQITCNAVSKSSYAAIIPLTLGMMLCINYITELLQLPDINEELFLQNPNIWTRIRNNIEKTDWKRGLLHLKRQSPAGKEYDESICRHGQSCCGF